MIKKQRTGKTSQYERNFVVLFISFRFSPNDSYLTRLPFPAYHAGKRLWGTHRLLYIIRLICQESHSTQSPREIRLSRNYLPSRAFLGQMYRLAYFIQEDQYRQQLCLCFRTNGNPRSVAVTVGSQDRNRFKTLNVVGKRGIFFRSSCMRIIMLNFSDTLRANIFFFFLQLDSITMYKQPRPMYLLTICTKQNNQFH